LLSDRAEIDTKPELEIYADDVKCSHGATVGQLDESAIFYLRSRGLSFSEARHILTRAFATAMIGGVPIDECRDYLVRAIERRLDSVLAGDQS
jgi:Fe-S cluster assembly protein SufD